MACKTSTNEHGESGHPWRAPMADARSSFKPRGTLGLHGSDDLGWDAPCAPWIGTTGGEGHTPIQEKQ
eukprot:1386776-Prorocentrum_lima.AAC.1